MPCPALVWCAERRIASLSMMRACRGRCSPIWMPVTLVRIGFDSPRPWTGAPGLRSYMPLCDGPPASHSRITDRRGVPPPFSLARARCRSSAGRLSPPSARLPTLRKVRRLTPSQVRGPRPTKSSIAISQKVGLFSSRPTDPRSQALLGNARPRSSASPHRHPTENRIARRETVPAKQSFEAVRSQAELGNEAAPRSPVSSVIEHELLRVQDHPQHVFQPLGAVLLSLHIAGRLCQLCLRWQPCVGGQIKLFDDLFC